MGFDSRNIHGTENKDSFSEPLEKENHLVRDLNLMSFYKCKKVISFAHLDDRFLEMNFKIHTTLLKDLIPNDWEIIPRRRVLLQRDFLNDYARVHLTSMGGFNSLLIPLACYQINEKINI